MSISLSNHESRIKVLEDRGSNITSGSGWINIGNTCLIQYGVGAGSKWNSFHKPFSSISALVSGGINGLWDLTISFTNVENSRFYADIRNHANSQLSCNFYWIAIGILYTYRYIIKSLLIFTPLSYLFNKEV